MATFFDVQLSAHYHTAKLRALYEKEHKPLRPGVTYGKWADLVDRVGERGPLLGQILAPERAMDVLEEHYQRYTVKKDEGRAPAATSRLGPGPLTKHDHAPSRHTTALWASYNWMFERVHGEPNKAVEAHIVEKKLGWDLYQDVEKRVEKRVKAKQEAPSDEPDDVFFDFFKRLLPPAVPETLIQEGTTQAEWDKILANITYKTLVAERDAKNVTRFQAQVEYPATKSESLAKIADGMDPRNWSRNFPQIFAKAYTIQGPESCRDRFQDPDPKDTKTCTDFTGFLFEDAAIELNAVRILRGRTLLNVDFKVTADNEKGAREAPRRKASQTHSPDRARGDKHEPLETGTVSCVYSLHEALSNHVLCLVAPSGPDVDLGPQNAYETELSLKGGQRWLKSTAGKAVRFSESCYFADEQNAFALPLWSLAIIAGLVRSIAI